MNTFAKKPLASVVAMAIIVLLFTGFLVAGTIAAQAPICLLDEDFSGSWLPSGWTEEGAGEWIQSFSNSAGGTSPEAHLWWSNIIGSYAYLDSKPVDTTGAPSLTLEYKSYIVNYSGGYNCTVYTRAHGGDSWTDVTPWLNPIPSSVGPSVYFIDISSDIGSATQVRFEFSGNPGNIQDWYVDDVRICYTLPAPPPVGGEAYPINRISLLGPWIAAAVLLGGGIIWYVLRRRRVQS